MPNHIILFKDANFHGDHKHVFDKEPNLNLVVTDARGQVVQVIDNEFFKSVSSLAILSGNWQFFSLPNFDGDPFPVVLGPGLYRFVGEYKIANDAIASLQSVDDPPTIAGDPLDGHIVLFEHANFHGDHRHVFGAEPNLADNNFDNVTSSIVADSGNWSLFFDSQMDGSFPLVLGPGIYPWVEDIGVTNDVLSSLQPSSQPATISNSVDNHAILFEHSGFHGAHKHVFTAEPNLNASDDDSFNDIVSSLAVLAGVWSFFRDANFVGPYAAPPLAAGIYPLVTDQGITNDDMSSLRPTVPEPAATGEDITGHVILFEHASFRGAHRHVFNAEQNLNADDDDDFNDSVSSIVVISGNWQFFRNSNFDDDYPSILGPGIYSWVEDYGIRNDDMSSLRTVDQEPNVTGEPLNAHVVLFEHRDFHGNHKHVVSAEANLNADEDDSFNDAVSSITVLAGNWAFFKNSNFDGQYPAILGPGCYPWVEDIEIKNDDLSSLEPTDGNPNVPVPIPLTSHMMLFIHANFHGDHKHVFTAEPDLFLVERDQQGRIVKYIDTEFSDSVSSIAVLEDQWQTFRDSEFQLPYDVILGGGLFPLVSDVGITNDDMSSLRVARPIIQFSGTVTFQIDSSFVPKPVVEPAFFQFQFFPDTRVVQVTVFLDISLPQGVNVHYLSSGDGSFPSNGEMTIPNASFQIKIPFPGTDSSATCTLSTDTAISMPKQKFTVTGFPADSTGNIKLVGAGSLQGGSPDTDDFSVEFLGVITPRPA
jgi:Beta/Gamma crystallin